MKYTLQAFAKELRRKKGKSSGKKRERRVHDDL
jgi:hypothetical protein